MYQKDTNQINPDRVRGQSPAEVTACRGIKESQYENKQQNSNDKG